MPSATLSWSTKHEESTMNTTPLKFRTPPMVRSSGDRNNNGIINFGSGQRGKAFNQSELAIRSPGFNLACDDCALQQPGLILRWCDDCGSAICDACILDRHPDHSITWYQEAVRGANRKYDEVLDDSHMKLKQLRTSRIKSGRFEREMLTKLHEVKSKVIRREKESGEMSAILKQHLDELGRLAEGGLNARTIVERRHAANTALSAGKALLKRQAVIVKQLKGVDRVVSDMAKIVLGHSAEDNGENESDEESSE